jgi:hypothetical protein
MQAIPIHIVRQQGLMVETKVSCSILGLPYVFTNHRASEEDQVMGDVENDGAASNGPQTTPPPARHDSSIEDSAPPGRWEALQRYPYLVTFVQRFNGFLAHKDLHQLESELKADLPTIHYSAVEEFVATMDMWLQSGTTEPPYGPAWDYFSREMAVRAREEAVEARSQLL